MKLLFVSKDLGGASVAAPVAEIADKNRDGITVVTEGLAHLAFMERGIPIFFQGTPIFNEVSFTLECDELLFRVKPDVVIATEGGPINLEESVGHAANRAGIPLVFLEDTQGGFVRSGAYPDAIITVDDCGARLAKERYGEIPIWVAGNPGVPTHQEVEEMTNCALHDFRAHGTRTYAFVGGDADSTGEQLELLKECLVITEGDWVLIPRFHPKWVKVTDPASGKTYGTLWTEMLLPLCDRIVHDPVGDGRKLVASADVSLADPSTLLTTAVCCGKTSVFLETPAVMKAMKKESGLDIMPLVELGCAHRVAEPTDLSLLRPPFPESLEYLKPYDPALAYQHIQKLVK